MKLCVLSTVIAGKSGQVMYLTNSINIIPWESSKTSSIEWAHSIVILHHFVIIMSPLYMSSCVFDYFSYLTVNLSVCLTDFPVQPFGLYVCFLIRIDSWL